MIISAYACNLKCRVIENKRNEHCGDRFTERMVDRFALRRTRQHLPFRARLDLELNVPSQASFGLVVGLFKKETRNDLHKISIFKAHRGFANGDARDA